MHKLHAEEMGRHDAAFHKAMIKMPLMVVLDNIRSALNVGSFFRTCDAFAADGLILCGITASPPHKEIQKTALGSTESVTWTYEISTATALAKLKEEGYKLIAVEQTSESIELNKFKPEAGLKYALIFGNEVDGVDETLFHLLDGALEINQFGTKHSLNVAVCGGIVIHFMANFFSKTQGTL